MKSNPLLLRHVATTLMYICLLVVISCQKANVVEVSPSIKVSNEDPTLRVILGIGFSKEQIVDHGDYYLVGGDIRFEKKNYTNINKGARPLQKGYAQSELVNHNDVSNITVRVAPDFLDLQYTDWQQKVITGTQNALNSWNTMSNSKVNFVYTTASTAKITISLEATLADDAYGAGEYPNNCGSGTYVKLNINSKKLTTSQLQYIIAHELGHTVGLAHTDEVGFSIRGTPMSDAASVMNSGVLVGLTADPNTVPSWNNFSSNDQLAVSALYPDVVNADAYRDASGNISLTWTPSRFCSRSVEIRAYVGNNTTPFRTEAGKFNNGGVYVLPQPYPQGTSYELRVSAAGSPSNYLWDVVN